MNAGKAKNLSLLFGAGQPGGVINLVPKQPLSEPFYLASFTAGNLNTYRGDLGFSAPLNKSKTVKSRLNLPYENHIKRDRLNYFCVQSSTSTIPIFLKSVTFAVTTMYRFEPAIAAIRQSCVLILLTLAGSD